MKNGVTSISDNVTDEQKIAHKDLKDYKIIFIIHQYVDTNNFDKVGDLDSSKESWDILEKYFGGVEKVKKVRLQTLKRTYEMLHMEESESVFDFFTRVIRMVNQIKMYGEVLTSTSIVANILR